MVSDRSPIVTVELQLRPQPPRGSTPWFWGGGMLDFLSADRRHPEVVWRAELPSFWTMRSARVRQDADFGWVLVVRLTHEEATRLLARHGWPASVDALGDPKAMIDAELRPRMLGLTY